MSERLRAGLIGLSGIAARKAAPGVQAGWGTRMPSTHAAAYHHVTDTEVVAVCDIMPAMLEKFQSEWKAELPEVNAYTDYRQMLAKERLDIVSVVTGDHLHAQLVVDVAAAGVKGIICEKPIATTLADADRMIAAVEQARIPMLVDHTRRWMFPWVQAAQAIKDGLIGEVLRIEAKEGGARAMLFRNGTHLIDSLVWMAGGSPKAIYGLTEERFPAYGPRYAGDGGKNPDTDPAVSALVEFDNGVRAFINMCKFTPDFFELDIFGSKGRMLVQEDDVCVTVKSDAYSFQTSRLPRDHFTQGAIAGCVSEMVHLIRHGGTPSSDGREARKTLEIMLGILQSQAKGGVRLACPVKDA